MLQGNASFGTVKDFVLTDSGCLEYAVIAADNGLVAVPWARDVPFRPSRVHARLRP